MCCLKALKGKIDMKEEEKIERELFNMACSFENMERWRSKGAGLINFQSKLESSNHIRKEISRIIETELNSQNTEKHVTPLRSAIESPDHFFTEFIQDQKMQSVALMAGCIAHDFKNFIHIIAVNTNKIISIKNDPEIVRHCNQIIDVCSRALELTNNMFSLARESIALDREIDLNEELKKDVAMLVKALPADIRLKTALFPNPLLIIGNATRISQVIVNLVNNAAEAMDSGGWVAIVTDRVELKEQDCLGHANARPGEFITITVSDSGPGISPESILRIFDPFYSTKKKKDNAGLGLAMVYAIIRDHHGWIDVESKPGKGTRFKIFFPFLHEGDKA
jgi:signal transduction histidine kinase